MKKKNFMSREKFFWVNPSLYNAREWPFKTRYAIGVRLADFRARNEKVFRFLIKGKMYSIPRDMAFHFGLKYMIPHGVLPNILPLDMFIVGDSPEGCHAKGNGKTMKPLTDQGKGAETQKEGMTLRLFA